MPGQRGIHIATRTVCAVLSMLCCSNATVADDNSYRHAEEQIGTVRQIYDGKLYPDLQVNTFRNIDRLFPTRTVRRGGEISALPVGELPFDDFRVVSGGASYDIYDILSL
ncbi:MAG TPA: hypothetical protein VLB07_14425, partial [Woeseiaceae bacterium]|nr:hypothetical protein [Woeseiaceae bacterium]